MATEYYRLFLKINTSAQAEVFAEGFTRCFRQELAEQWEELIAPPLDCLRKHGEQLFLPEFRFDYAFSHLAEMRQLLQELAEACPEDAFLADYTEDDNCAECLRLRLAYDPAAGWTEPEETPTMEVLCSNPGCTGHFYGTTLVSCPEDAAQSYPCPYCGTSAALSTERRELFLRLFDR